MEYDYDAVNPDELSIKVGDTITNITVMDGGWWEGEVNGKRGMFPDNFVKVIKSDSSKPAATTPAVNGQAGTEVVKRENSAQKKKLRARVAFSYAPQNEDELSLEVDEEIEVTSQPEQGWWEGIVKGKKGMFPSNFVVLLSEEDEKKQEENAASDMLIKPKQVGKGPGFGNIFEKGPFKLKPVAKTGANKTDSGKTDSVKVTPQDQKKPVKDDSSTSSGSKEKALVEYDYDPKNGDELPLKKGAIITIISKDAGDKGWWKGESDGKTGVFPDNFVKLLPPETEQKSKIPPSRPVVAPKAETKRTSMKMTPPSPAKEEKKPPAGGRAVFPGPPKPRVKPPPDAKKPAKATPADDATKDFDDALKPTSAKLTHPTRDRPKIENKRPPSSHGSVNENFVIDSFWEQQPWRNSKSSTAPTPNQHDDVSNATPAASASSSSVEPSNLPPWTRELKSKSLRRPPAAAIENGIQQENHTPLGTAKLSPTVPKATPGTNTSSGSGTSDQIVNELKDELKALRNEMAAMKRELKKEMENLVQELDEEKKLRMNMQVELDRLRKKITH